MNFSVKDVLLAGLVSTFLFPVILLAILLFSGAVHLDVGVDDGSAKKLNEFLESIGSDQKNADEAQLPVFQANKARAQEVEEQMANMAEEKKRLEKLRAENLQIKKQIEAARNQIESMVNKDEELKEKKLQSLAQMYGSMKPIEAAPILVNMPDSSIAEILENITDIRSQAKLMAALGALDEQRAATISKLMGLEPDTPQE